MLRLCVKAENKKLRHSVIWAACILIPIIPAIMGTFNYQQNLGILTGKWYSLWSQLSLASGTPESQLECTDDRAGFHSQYLFFQAGSHL